MKLPLMKRPKILPLQWIVHTGSWIPLIWLAWTYWAGRLSVNPIQDAEKYTGRYAITFLMLSLACTPLHTLFKWSSVLKVRRALGLYAFLYVGIHISLLIGVDYAFAFDLLWADLSHKPYIIVGFLTLLTLIPLALTSTKGWMKRLGKNWKRLHKLIYISGVLAVIHYAWAQKGDLFSLRGNIVQPLIYGVVLALLLMARIPAVRRRIVRIRDLAARRPSRPQVQEIRTVVKS